MLWLWVFAGCAPVPASEPEIAVPPADAVRLTRTPAGVVLEVASDRYPSPSGGELWLVGAIQVAEPVLFDVARARLAAADVVWVEGYHDDRPGAPSGPPLTVPGLVGQHDVPDAAEWRRTDVAASTVAAWMRADGVPEAEIARVLHREPGDATSVASGERGAAIAELQLLRALMPHPNAEPADPLRKEYLIHRRDQVFVDAILSEPYKSGAFWLGADHLEGVGGRLVEAGYRLRERVWVPALSVGYLELELGPVQVQQLLDRR